MGEIPAREMLNPLPPVTVQIMAATVEVQENGPTPVVSPYANVGVSTPALLPHPIPEQVRSEPSVDMTTDWTGEIVSQRTDSVGVPVVT